MLAAGLISAGLGAMPVLQSMLRGYVDSSVLQLVGTDVYETVFDVAEDPETGEISFASKSPEPRTEYVIALYNASGELTNVAGGAESAARDPLFPTELTVQDAFLSQGHPFTLDALKGAEYRAAVIPIQVDGSSSSTLYAQLVALPLDDVDSFVTTYIGVFTTMTVLTLIVGALGTRWLVTLAFRRLGQVESTAMSIADGAFAQRMTDIEPTTEVGRLKIAINTMLDRLDDSFAERDATVEKMRRFIGDASHELRTPLVSVRGYAELYRMGAMQTPEDTARAMERIEKEAQRMASLVEDLLSLARLDERRELEIVDVDLRRIAHDAALDVRAADQTRQVAVNDTTFEALTGPITILSEGARGQLEAPGPAAAPAQPPAPHEDPDAPRRDAGPPTGILGALTGAASARAAQATRGFWRRRPTTGDAAPAAGASIAPLDFSEPEKGKPVDVPPVVRGAEEKIQQVVANLLGNARRYSPPDSPIEIEVGVDVDTDMGWISVVDHGEGIPAEIREKIFQRFWRADTSRTRETGGSGLGLAIVASIVERLDGSVAVFETPGGGATFQVAFPLAQAAG
ncbi:HAMP domain-containing sensor histidine kinase [Microbacterium karelineae]|uniref:HAMP domain-containing sensor histidine kinase n=1 Tax=Microbacterium karelineae TaxID=2654283 RepID=UPI001E35072C|nr:HAMP domain-containing sensor histidine kinase [Microbacterium karelineae]